MKRNGHSSRLSLQSNGIGDLIYLFCKLNIYCKISLCYRICPFSKFVHTKISLNHPGMSKNSTPLIRLLLSQPQIRMLLHLIKRDTRPKQPPSIPASATRRVTRLCHIQLSTQTNHLSHFATRPVKYRLQ